MLLGDWLNGTRLSDASELYRTQVEPQARAFMKKSGLAWWRISKKTSPNRAAPTCLHKEK